MIRIQIKIDSTTQYARTEAYEIRKNFRAGEDDAIIGRDLERVMLKALDDFILQNEIMK